MSASDQRPTCPPAQALADSGTVQRTAPPSAAWRRLEIGIFLLVAPPGVVALAYLIACLVGVVADALGPVLLS